MNRSAADPLDSLPLLPPLRAIGYVRNEVREGAVRWEEVISQIELAPELGPALEGLEEFSHIVVLFAFHRREEPPLLQVRPERRADMPLVGVLATRSPRRPNPIGMAVVALLRREGTVLHVRGLDALDGSPVLDIKPYLPRGDQAEAPRLPAWLLHLWGSLDEEQNDG